MADKLIVALIVGVAFTFAFRGIFRMFKGQEPGCAGCSCSSSCSSIQENTECKDLVSK